MTLRAALFDIDGTLVDSNDAHARAWVDAFARHGRRVAFEQIRPMIGMGSDKLLAALAEELGEPDAFSGEHGEAIAHDRKSTFLERGLHDVTAFPGARELVHALAAGGLRCIVASSASPEELGPLLAIAGVADAFDDAVKSDEVQASKPDADTIATGLRKAGVGADEAMMIGDTRFDIEAAHRSHVRSVAFACGGSSAGELAAADARFDGPADMLAAWQRGTFAFAPREPTRSGG